MAVLGGRPAGGGETLTNPCDKWFCKAARFPVNGRPEGSTRRASTATGESDGIPTGVGPIHTPR